MDIQALQSFVENSLRHDFPDQAVACRFVPLLDPALGDLGSDVLKQLAKVRRESPEALTAKALPRLTSSAFGDMQVVDGFLNLTISDQLLLQPLRNIPPQRSPRNIVVAPPHRGLDQLGYARVVSSAVTQWFLTGQSSILVSAAGCLTPGSTLTELGPWLQSTLHPAAEICVSEYSLECLVTALGKGSTVFWLYPDFLDRGRFRRLLEQIRQSIDHAEIHLQCLDRERLTRISDSFAALQGLLSEAALLAPTLLYLSRSTSGGDLDLSTPRNQERANIHWSLPSLRARLERIYPEDHLPPAPVAPQGALAAIERSCLVRSQLLPLFAERAGTVGAVMEFLGAVDNLVEVCTRYLNDPRIRIARQTGTPNPADHAIISGVQRSVSGIIRSCLLFQALELVQP